MNWKFWKRTPDCEHTFDRWEINRTLYSKTGAIILLQHRFCSKCGFCQINRQEKM